MAKSKNVILKDSENNTLFPQIADGSVITNKLADGSVTKAKLADDISLASVTNTTWYELKCLRDTGKLTPGMQYRITDYQCTTKQKNTQSTGHQFDIIVTADSANKLNEKARACLHEGDTYFKNCNLAAWEIWYSLDNDTSRFTWADYAYIPFGLSSSCDDSNAILLTEETINYNGKDYYKGYLVNPSTLTMETDGPYVLVNSFFPKDGDSILYFNSEGELNAGESNSGVIGFSEDYSNIKMDYEHNNTIGNDNYGKGVIYRMIDEWHNDCPYDFKNILFVKDNKTYYTFTYNTVASEVLDGSIEHDSIVSERNCIASTYNDRLDSVILCATDSINDNKLINSDNIFIKNDDCIQRNVFNNSYNISLYSTGDFVDHNHFYNSQNINVLDGSVTQGIGTVFCYDIDSPENNALNLANLLGSDLFSGAQTMFITLHYNTIYVKSLADILKENNIDLSPYAKTLASNKYSGLDDNFVSTNQLAKTAKDDHWVWLAGFDIENNIAYIGYNRGYLAIVDLSSNEVLDFIKLASFDDNASEIHNGANCLTAIKIDDNNTYLYVSAVRYANKKCYVEKLTKTVANGKTTYASTLVCTINYTGSKFHQESGVDFIIDKTAKKLYLIGGSTAPSNFDPYDSPKTFLRYSIPDVTANSTYNLTDDNIELEYNAIETAGITQQGSCIDDGIMYYMGSEEIVVNGDHQRSDIVVYDLNDKRFIRTIKVDNFIPNLPDRSECEGISLVENSNGDKDICVSYHAYGSYGENHLACKLYKLPFKASEVVHGGSAFYVTNEDVDSKLKGYVKSSELANHEQQELEQLSSMASRSYVDSNFASISQGLGTLSTKVNSLHKLVSTTESAYAALTTKDSNTVYCIPEE